jgi:anaerobic ribonucleoside-triphosphate reductase activating protein
VSLDTWDVDPTREVPVAELGAWLAELSVRGLDGITLSGGEPFDQPEALAALLDEIDRVRSGSTAPIDVLCFSGRPLRLLERRHSDILARLDAVISGPYLAGRPTRLIWRGSANQELVPLSTLGEDRYRRYVEHEPDRAPMQVSADGQIWLIGVPHPGDLAELERRLASAGIHAGGASWRA